MRKGMGEKVEVALARFDRAVKESSIRSGQIGQEKGRRTHLLSEQPMDIASRIAVEGRGGRLSGESSHPLSLVAHAPSAALSM